ncbi:hypothetical protein [Brasilonema bromeliae]|uniref:hypothetical protein n=1 Tax=Brasilonema bromeliae TaxID=383615 RepID=UPI00145DA6B0|nr:hypothetical protein [Brasilonema bromeliae]
MDYAEILITPWLMRSPLARPTPEAQSASPELRSGNQASLGWAYTGDRYGFFQNSWEKFSPG